jgi:hypothetical protein
MSLALMLVMCVDVAAWFMVGATLVCVLLVFCEMLQQQQPPQQSCVSRSVVYSLLVLMLWWRVVGLPRSCRSFGWCCCVRLPLRSLAPCPQRHCVCRVIHTFCHTTLQQAVSVVELLSFPSPSLSLSLSLT